MKSFIFNKSFDELFTKPRLLYELSQLKPKPNDFLEVQTEIKKEQFFNLKPNVAFFLPKSDGTYRQIAIPSTKTKIIQKILAQELSNSVKFSDRSYAFQKGKSPYKAITRVLHNLKRYS